MRFIIRFIIRLFTKKKPVIYLKHYPLKIIDSSELGKRFLKN